MSKAKLILGIAVLLIAAGLIFAFLPHDLHESVTFGLNIPHFLHFVMGLIIIGTGLVCILYSIKQGTFRFPIDMSEIAKINNKYLRFPSMLKNTRDMRVSSDIASEANFASHTNSLTTHCTLVRSVFDKIKNNLKKPVPLLIILLLIAGFAALNYVTKDVKAETEFDKMKEAAKYCTNPADTYPQCTQSFEQLRKGSEHMQAQKSAQEKIGIVEKYGEDDGFNATEYLSAWNYNNLPANERSKYYRETIREDGSLLREYWITAEDKEIEIAPGVFFPAWTYNGQVPAPTIRATEGDRIRIHFTNKGTKPHTMHFHGFHPSSMDGAMSEDFVYPGQSFTYEFDADPFGVHLFHCHSVPLKQHISKGLYGAYIVDPKNDTRPKPGRELVMVMNAFDTTLDGENEVYAVNTKAFYYAMNPIKVKKDELIRIYLINIVEFDPVNSFHLHATFFDEYRTGTKQEPDAYTDIVSFAQAERSILDVRFRYPGMYMFHAHVSEFTELGWMGFFEVTE